VNNSSFDEEAAVVKEERTVVIDRPIQQVFAYVTDQTKTPSWQAGLLEVRAAVE